jgi:hypothetical protein
MSIVAWDGKILAADRQCTVTDTIFTIQKLWKLSSGEVVAFVGIATEGLLIKQWYEAGAKPENWPECKEEDDRLKFIVASKEGCFFYDGEPIKIKVLDPFRAWGIGREAALGAMAMGANAIEAVKIASKHVIGCGRGCDWVEVIPGERLTYPWRDTAYTGDIASARKPRKLSANKEKFMEM